MIKIRTCCQYIGYLQRKPVGPHKTFDWAAGST